jgi:hypothetical protein
MNKPILLVILLLSFLSVQSQIELGLKGGYFFYTVTGEKDHDTPKYSLTPDSYILSIAAYTRRNATFNVGIELEYLTRSFDVKSSAYWAGGGENLDYHIRLDQLSCQIKPQFVFGHKVKFFIYPGLFFGYFVNTKMSGIKSGYIMSESYTDTVSGTAEGFYHNLDFGLMAGIGLEIPIRKGFCVVCENNYSFNLATGSFASQTANLFLNMKFEAGIAYTFNSRKKEKDSPSR